MAKRRIPSDPKPRKGPTKRTSRERDRGGRDRDRDRDRGRGRGKDRGYLADLDEEDYDRRDERPYSRSRKKNDATIPIILGVCALMLVLIGITLLNHPEIWDSELKAARLTVQSTDDLSSMMTAMEKLIVKDDIAGMRLARNHFIQALKKKSGSDADEWKKTVGDKILVWASQYDHDTRDAILPWVQAGKEAWVGDPEEYKMIMDELHEEGVKLEQLCNRVWFNETIIPLFDINSLPVQKGKSLAEAQGEFTKALHFDWTTVKFIFKKPYFQGNENPFLRGHFQINDETFWFDINFDIKMKKQSDGSWAIEDAEITSTKK